MANNNIKKNDVVIVITGEDKGSKGKVLETNPKTGRVIVEGVNIVKKHKKARSAQQQSGIFEVEASIDASNVMLVCPKCGKPAKVGVVINENGSKSRVCKECKAVIDTYTPAKN
ncbi:MAG: 50S ribosomal protein L24 [Clostridia bacterium]|nr:50S ribosomal protein L24 [Clostridia bacterium]